MFSIFTLDLLRFQCQSGRSLNLTDKNFYYCILPLLVEYLSPDHFVKKKEDNELKRKLAASVGHPVICDHRKGIYIERIIYVTFTEKIIFSDIYYQ